MKKGYTYAPNPFKKMPLKVKKLPVACAIYVPNTDKEGKNISDIEFKKRIQEVEEKILQLFGGHITDELEHGGFIGKNKKLISEKVSHVSVFSDIQTYKKHRSELEKWLLKKKKEWNQENIGYEFEGDLYYL